MAKKESNPQPPPRRFRPLPPPPPPRRSIVLGIVSDLGKITDGIAELFCGKKETENEG